MKDLDWDRVDVVLSTCVYLFSFLKLVCQCYLGEPWSLFSGVPLYRGSFARLSSDLFQRVTTRLSLSNHDCRLPTLCSSNLILTSRTVNPISTWLDFVCRKIFSVQHTMRRRGRPPKRSSGGRPEGSDQPELPSPSRQTEDPSILSGRSSLSQAQSDSLLSDSTVPFFNTTLFTYRVSPLHLGDNPLTPGRLQVLSQRLRDTVVGDVVRGVEVGLVGDDTSMPRAGVLQFVDVRWVNLGTILGLDPAGSSSRSPSQDLGSDGAEPISSAKDPGDPAARERVGKIALRRRALLLSLRYENAFYTALLVPPLVEDTTPLDIQGKPLNEDRFVTLPLLLLRMPAPLRPIIVDFLSTNFDCRISQLRFGTRTLVTSLESWMATTGLAASESAAKDVVLTLGFSLPAPGMPDSETEEARPGNPGPVSYTHLRAPRDRQKSRMPSSA